MSDFDPSGHSVATDEDARFIFAEWDRRARSRDVPDLLELYTDDAILESPLVPRILGTTSGVLRGREAIGRFLTEGTLRRPNALVRWHRNGQYLWDGRTLSWEYLRATPDATRSTSPRSWNCEDLGSPPRGSTGAGSVPRC